MLYKIIDSNNQNILVRQNVVSFVHVNVEIKQVLKLWGRQFKTLYEKNGNNNFTGTTFMRYFGLEETSWKTKHNFIFSR